MRGCESAGRQLGPCWRGRPSLAPRTHPRPQRRDEEGGSWGWNLVNLITGQPWEGRRCGERGGGGGGGAGRRGWGDLGLKQGSQHQESSPWGLGAPSPGGGALEPGGAGMGADPASPAPLLPSGAGEASGTARSEEQQPSQALRAGGGGGLGPPLRLCTAPLPTAPATPQPGPACSGWVGAGGLQPHGQGRWGQPPQAQSWPGLLSGGGGGRRMEPEAAAWGCAEGFWGDNWAAIKCSRSSGCGPSPVTAAL